MNNAHDIDARCHACGEEPAGHLTDDGRCFDCYTPAVNDGATIRIGSDTYGATIVKITPHTITARYDRGIRIDKNGQSESQRWIHVIDPKGETITFRRTKDGWTWRGCYRLTPGIRDSYRDPSF